MLKTSKACEFHVICRSGWKEVDASPTIFLAGGASPSFTLTTGLAYVYTLQIFIPLRKKKKRVNTVNYACELYSVLGVIFYFSVSKNFFAGTVSTIPDAARNHLALIKELADESRCAREKSLGSGRVQFTDEQDMQLLENIRNGSTDIEGTTQIITLFFITLRGLHRVISS